MKYVVFDRGHNPLTCLLFGSSAWKCALRDDFIGWNANTRKDNLQFLTNNTRFLILPWVQVPHLASHILASVTRRISAEWIENTAIPFISWKPLWNGNAFKAFVSRLSIGSVSVKPKGAAAMIAMLPLKCRSKIFTFTH